ncbi:MAG: type II secretion system protein [Alphaproteobacteria bacterium]|nr:type II secretion system protein [Alphaproteobacteria bacterium]
MPHPRSFLRRYQRGFTLVEMSMVILVIGMVLLIVYPALNMVRVSTQRSLTDSNLQTLLRATAVYVQANGCLPCPAPANVSGPGFGRIRGDTNTAACGACAQPEGIAPFVSLGLPQSMAHDGWGRWITMRVDPALTVNFAVVPPTAPCQPTDPSPCNGSTTAGQSIKGLCRSSLPAANRISIQTGDTTQQAAVIFVSHGVNGYGAFIASAISGSHNGERLPFPSGQPNCTNGHEQCNAVTTSLTFYNDPITTGNDNNSFDDVLLFVDRNNLVSWLGNGSCQTTW